MAMDKFQCLFNLIKFLAGTGTFYVWSTELGFSQSNSFQGSKTKGMCMGTQAVILNGIG